MTSTLSLQGEAIRQRRYYSKSWVVPTSMLRTLIDQFRYVWQAESIAPQRIESEEDDVGWRTQLSLQVAAITGGTEDAALRNLYRVMAAEQDCIRADFADAVCMSLEMNLDRDTNIPSLPGNLNIAQELLEVRDPDFWSRPRLERIELTRTVMALTNLIIDHPERLEELQDQAPFDCLRPPR